MTTHARIGPVVGLALLTGGTAGAAVSEGSRAGYAAFGLLLLTLGVGCALVDEVRRQARRHATWTRTDTVNAALLGGYAAVTLTGTVFGVLRLPEQVLGLLLSVAYGVLCGYFVWRRRQATAHA